MMKKKFEFTKYFISAVVIKEFLLFGVRVKVSANLFEGETFHHMP